jgi:hypothetical protein
MSTRVSTKIRTLLDLLPAGAALPGKLKRKRAHGEEALHGRVVLSSLAHALTQYLSDETRNTHAALSSMTT